MPRSPWLRLACAAACAALAAPLAGCPTPMGDDDDGGDPGPDIQHNAVTEGDEGVAIDLSAIVRPPEGAAEDEATLVVMVNYRAEGDSAFSSVELLDEDGDDRFEGQIPADGVNLPAVEYYIDADWDGAASTHPEDAPDSVHTVSLTPAPLGSPDPVRARFDPDSGDVVLTWTASAGGRFLDYTVTAESDTDGVETVCEGSEPDDTCTVDGSETYGTEYATWTVTLQDIDEQTTSGTAVTDSLHLYEGEWAKETTPEDPAPAGTGVGEFSVPYGIALGNDRVYVVEQGNHRMQVFTSAGTYQGVVGAASGAGVPGDGTGEFSGVHDVAVGPEGEIYTADFSNARVQVFHPETQQYQRAFGTIGEGDGELRFPAGLAFDDEGLLHVVETLNARVSVFDADGAFQYSYDEVDGEALVNPWRIDWLADRGQMAIADGRTTRLYDISGGGNDDTWELLPSSSEGRVGGICVSGWGEYIVTLDDTQQTGPSVAHRLVKLDADGNEIGEWGEWGNDELEFFRPVDCAFGEQGELLVVDALNHRVQLLGP